MKNAIKVADDIFMVPWYEGNGVIRRVIRVGVDGRAVQYLLAYYNLEYFSGDNGRVMGFDYENGELKEWMLGAGTAGTFGSLVELEERFEKQWNELPKQIVDPTEQPSAPGGIAAHDTGDYAEQKAMRLTIAKGDAADFFRRGRELAAKAERGEAISPEKIILFGHRHELCYTIRGE